MEPEAVMRVMDAYRDRYLAHRAQPEVAYVQIILNYGGARGLPGPLALPGLRHPLRAGGCGAELKLGPTPGGAHAAPVPCTTLVSSELAGERRGLLEPALRRLHSLHPRYPFETWVVPRRRAAPLRGLRQRGTGTPGRGAPLCAGGLGWATPPTTSSSAPGPAPAAPAIHWHFELLPPVQLGGLRAGQRGDLHRPAEEATRFLRDNL